MCSDSPAGEAAWAGDLNGVRGIVRQYVGSNSHASEGSPAAPLGPGLRRYDEWGPGRRWWWLSLLVLRRGLQRVAPVPDLPAQIDRHLAVRDDLAALDLPHLDVAGDDVAVLVQVDRTGGAFVVNVLARGD